VVRVRVRRPSRWSAFRRHSKPGGEGIIAWIAQTFLQLVLLSIIIVGQNIAAASSDKRAENTFKDAEAILSEAMEIQKSTCRLRRGADGPLKDGHGQLPAGVGLPMGTT